MFLAKNNMCKCAAFAFTNFLMITLKCQLHLSHLSFQRIMGEKIIPGIRFFGQSINGDFDLGVDGLPDIVVGSQGFVVVLRYGYIIYVTESCTHIFLNP